MYVKDYRHAALTTMTPDTLLSTAYQIMTMRGARIRHLPVVTDQQTRLGIITDRDVRQVRASDAPYMAEHELIYLLGKLRMQEVMTQDVVTVRSTTSLL